ncbi:MAG TPA: hypothetical protein DD001_22955, partial [Microcoleaceae bacterium UBA10368]|nr:hypothetical protein [Microcoleaceae cyanobacterium UBA10368]
QLIAAFNTGSGPDILVPSSLNKPMVQNLLNCQRAMRLMGGIFSLEILENNLVVARLVMPMVSS